MALSKTTQDHQEIRQWAETRGAKPAEVGGTDSGGQSGVLRLEFPNAPHANDSKLQTITWEEFFEKFDDRGLAMILQDVTAEGEESNFNRFVYPENAKGDVTPNTSSPSGAEESEDDEDFEDAAVDEPGDIDSDAGDRDDKEFVHLTAEDVEEDGGDDLNKAAESAGGKSASKKSATKSASSNTDSPRTAPKASAKESTTNSARGRH